MVGPCGGGCEEQQLSEIEKLSNHIGINISNQDVKNVAKALFGGTNTFKDGQIGSWKKYFLPQHKDLFKRYAGDLLISLGYEMSQDW